MFTKELLALSDFMAQSKRSLDDVCEFLSIVTFKFLSPRALYIGEVCNDGYIDMRSSYGFDSGSKARWSRIPMTVDIPLTQCISKNECIVIPNPKEFFKKYPDLKDLGEIDTDWSTSIAIPLQRRGAFYLVLHGTPEMSLEFDQLLRSVANLILISLQQSPPPPPRQCWSESGFCHETFWETRNNSQFTYSWLYQS